MDKILARLASNAQAAGKTTPVPKTDGRQTVEHNRELRSVSSPAQSSNQDMPIYLRAAGNQGTTNNAQISGVHDFVAPSERAGIETTEMIRLQRELMAANSRIAQQEQELAETRVIKQTLDQALGPSSEMEIANSDATQSNLRHLQTSFNASLKGFNIEHDPWMQDDTNSDISEPFSAGVYGTTTRNLWGFPTQNAFGFQGSEKPYSGVVPAAQGIQDPVIHPWAASANNSSIAASTVTQPHRVFSGPSAAPDGRFAGEQPYVSGVSQGLRRSVSQMSRAPAYFQPLPSTWTTFNTAATNNVATKAPLSPGYNTYQQVGLFPMPQYQPRPIGTPLSPTAAEFTSSNSGPSAWHGATVSITYFPVVLYHDHDRSLTYSRLEACHLLRMSRRWSHSTIAACWIRTSPVTGNILSTRLSATAISKLPYSSSKSLKWAQLSKNTTLLRPL